MKQWITALVGLSLLATVCAGQGTTTTAAPEVGVKPLAVTTTVVETPTTTTRPEVMEDTEEVTPEPGEVEEDEVVGAVAEREPVTEKVAAV